MFILGMRNKKIKEYDDDFLVCECCGNAGLNFSVFRHYAHIFFIPVFPIGGKTIVCNCKKCGAECRGAGKKSEYLSKTRTPLYMFTVFFFLIVLFIISAVMDFDESRKESYIINPRAGDIYLIKDEGGGTVRYYFFKVKRVGEESVIVYHGDQTYNKSVSQMSNDDYFITNDAIEIFKEDLKEYLDKGIINYVKRNSGDSGNFANEEKRIK